MPHTPASPSADHSFPGSSRWRRHSAPVPGRSLRAARAAGAPPREQPGTRLKRKSGKKEKKRGRVNPKKAEREEQRRGGRGGSGSGAPCLARQPAGPRGGLGARCGDHVRPRSPPAAAATRRSGGPGLPAARAPQVSVCLRRVGVPLAFARGPAGRGAPRPGPRRRCRGGGGGFTCRWATHYGLHPEGP